jgi:cytochrome d ubiquinol oxidase subunit I
LLSFVAASDVNAEVTGLQAFKAEDRPPVQLSFQSFHLMVAIGMTLIVLCMAGVLMWWRGLLFDTSNRMVRIYLWVMVFAVILPQIANQAGWCAAEVGRQPWVVYGLMRTSEGLSESVVAGQIWFSLVLFTFIYALLFALFVFLLDRKIGHGPVPETELEPHAKRHIPFEDGKD